VTSLKREKTTSLIYGVPEFSQHKSRYKDHYVSQFLGARNEASEASMPDAVPPGIENSVIDTVAELATHAIAAETGIPMVAIESILRVAANIMKGDDGNAGGARAKPIPKGILSVEEERAVDVMAQTRAFYHSM